MLILDFNILFNPGVLPLSSAAKESNLMVFIDIFSENTNHSHEFQLIGFETFSSFENCFSDFE